MENVATRALAKRESPRALAVSRALRQMARQLRHTGPAASARGNVVVPMQRWSGIFHRVVWISFLAIVVAPVTAASIYFGIVATPRYVATAQFTVRAGDPPTTEGLGGIASLSSDQPAQDTKIVANYIGSSDMVNTLSPSVDLRRAYSRPWVDPFSRADPASPTEKFDRYWNHRVKVKVDNLSNVVTVSAQAFTPQDAMAIATGVLGASERLVNEMSDRARADALRNSLTTLGTAQRELAMKTTAVRDLRNASGIIDPEVTSKFSADALGQLNQSLAELQIQYSGQLRWVGPDAPQMQILRRQIDETRRQIAAIKSELAGPPSGGSTTLANSAALFEKANLDLQVAQTQYVDALASVEKRRADLEAQRVYVLPFEQPILPQRPLYPRRLLSILEVAGACLALWGAGIGMALLARNNLAL